MEINLDIKSEKDLNQLSDYLKEKGFGWLDTYKLHSYKIDKIINNANTLNIDYNSNLKNELYYEKTYADAEEKAKQFFSKFSVDDKIKEYLNTFYLQSDDNIRTPYSRPNRKDVIDWVNFKTKYDLTDEFGPGNFINVYNLDKNILKTSFNYSSSYKFKRFYELIFNEEPNDINYNDTGIWQDLGKIEIKIYKNNKADIKGDLDKLKQYYYNYSKNSGGNNIIKYNGKKEIIKSKND